MHLGEHRCWASRAERLSPAVKPCKRAGGELRGKGQRVAARCSRLTNAFGKEDRESRLYAGAPRSEPAASKFVRPGAAVRPPGRDQLSQPPLGIWPLAAPGCTSSCMIMYACCQVDYSAVDNVFAVSRRLTLNRLWNLSASPAREPPNGENSKYDHWKQHNAGLQQLLHASVPCLP